MKMFAIMKGNQYFQKDESKRELDLTTCGGVESAKITGIKKYTVEDMQKAAAKICEIAQEYGITVEDMQEGK